MSDSTSTITVALKAKDDTKPAFESAGASMGNLGKIASTVGGVLAGAFAVGKIIEFGKASVEQSIEAERSMRQLQHAILDVSHGTKDQVTAVNDLADALQKKAGIDDDSLKAGVAQLSTFGLSSDMVVKLTKSLADLTVNQYGVNASSDQYIDSANVIAKALNGQFGILEKSGIRFTDAQQKMIQFGSATERTAALTEGFNQNLRETTDTVGKSAEGAMARLSRAFEDIEKSIGAIILPILAQLAEAFVPIANSVQGFVDRLQGLWTWLEQIWQSLKEAGVIDLVKQSFQEIYTEFTTNLLPALQQLWTALQPFMPLFKAIAEVVGIAIVAAFVLVVKTVETFIIIAAKIIEAWAKFVTWEANTLAPVWDNITKSIASVVDWVQKLIDKLQALNLVQDAKNIGASIVKSITGKAVGGPVSGSTPYLVGEQGPELFIPNNGGRIVPNSQMGAGGITIMVTGNTFMGKEGIARIIGDELVNQLKLNARLAS